MRPTSVRGTPFRSLGPNADQGFRQGGSATNTVQPQYREGGINTAQNSSGTPAQYKHGNAADAKRVASHDKYGKVIDPAAGNMSDPASNGSGVILNGDPSRDMLDSPVPPGAPMFDEGYIATENLAHLGSGNAAGVQDLANAGGVMSRGMKGTSTPGGAETELTDDDTLPAVGPAGKG